MTPTNWSLFRRQTCMAVVRASSRLKRNWPIYLAGKVLGDKKKKLEEKIGSFAFFPSFFSQDRRQVCANYFLFLALRTPYALPGVFALVLLVLLHVID